MVVVVLLLLLGEVFIKFGVWPVSGAPTRFLCSKRRTRRGDYVRDARVEGDWFSGSSICML